SWYTHAAKSTRSEEKSPRFAAQIARTEAAVFRRGNEACALARGARRSASRERHERAFSAPRRPDAAAGSLSRATPRSRAPANPPLLRGPCCRASLEDQKAWQF